MNMENFTTLIGANASGKTNAIEGIRILSEIVSGIELSVVLDGVENTETGIRGGSRGCCRFDTNTFSLGCTVCLDEEYDLGELKRKPGETPGGNAEPQNP